MHWTFFPNMGFVQWCWKTIQIAMRCFVPRCAYPLCIKRNNSCYIMVCIRTSIKPFNSLVVQSCPPQPCAQSHVNEATPSTQLPPFWHGLLGKHSSMSVVKIIFVPENNVWHLIVTSRYWQSVIVHFCSTFYRVFVWNSKLCYFSLP